MQRDVKLKAFANFLFDFFISSSSPAQGRVELPPKGLLAITFQQKRYRNEILFNCQWINNKSVDVYKIEHCPYMREGEGPF